MLMFIIIVLGFTVEIAKYLLGGKKDLFGF